MLCVMSWKRFEAFNVVCLINRSPFNAVYSLIRLIDFLQIYRLVQISINQAFTKISEMFSKRFSMLYAEIVLMIKRIIC